MGGGGGGWGVKSLSEFNKEPKYEKKKRVTEGWTDRWVQTNMLPQLLQSCGGQKGGGGGGGGHNHA